MSIVEVYPDRGIKITSEGSIRTGGLIACFGILAYLEKGDESHLVMGHHSSLKYQPILENWLKFKINNPELQVYDNGKILVAKINPEPQGNNSWKQDDGRIMPYSERFNGLMDGLRFQHPNIEIVPVNYSSGSEFIGSLDDLAWKTNTSNGSLKPQIPSTN